MGTTTRTWKAPLLILILVLAALVVRHATAPFEDAPPEGALNAPAPFLNADGGIGISSGVSSASKEGWQASQRLTFERPEGPRNSKVASAVSFSDKSRLGSSLNNWGLIAEAELQGDSADARHGGGLSLAGDPATSLAPRRNLAACPAGQYSTDGTDTASGCSTCSAGQYSAASGATACASCPAGAYSPSSGATGCSACPAGQWALSEGQSACTSMPTPTTVHSPSHSALCFP